MNRNQIIKSSIIFCVSLGLYASEVDSFGQRNIKLQDSSDQINKLGNDLTDDILSLLNKEDHQCDEITLYKNLRKAFNNHYIGTFTKTIINSKEIDRAKISTADSIYGDFDIKDAIVTGYTSKKISDPIASLLNFNDIFIGTDKFEHFSGTGFRYFKSYYLEHKSIEETMNIGKRDEDGLLGAYTTGVISFGDLTAEFNGMRFWNDLLSRRKDILSSSAGPYVICENQKWKKIKNINFNLYVDDAWDEAINCSNFRNQTMLNKVKNRVQLIEEKTGTKIECPADLSKNKKMKEKYGHFSPLLINSSWSSMK